MSWRISRALHDRLLAEAAATPDVEVCGLLFGGNDEVCAVQPCRNVAEHPADSFEIEPQALIKALKAERAGGPKMTGCYHSHPNGEAEPSTRDAEAATVGLWVIIANDTLHGWASDGRGGFQRLVLSVLPADSPSAKDDANQGI
jgi:desampylase